MYRHIASPFELVDCLWTLLVLARQMTIQSLWARFESRFATLRNDESTCCCIIVIVVWCFLAPFHPEGLFLEHLLNGFIRRHEGYAIDEFE